MRLLALLLVFVMATGLSCTSTPDSQIVERLFMHLSRGEYDAAASLMRSRDGSPLTDEVRARNIAGWRRAYDNYDIEFSRVVVTRVRPVTAEMLAAADATEGYVETVRFEGRSNSPCVPVNSDVIPGASIPIALRARSGAWFVTDDSMSGFVHTCPGA